jgi:integrase
LARNIISSPAKKILLPYLALTELANEKDRDAVPVTIPKSLDRAEEVYFVHPLIIGTEGMRRDGKPRWVKHQFNLFPLVLDREGVPWSEATVYLLSKLEGVTDPVMTTYASIAEDLAAYRWFLDDAGLDWTHFPSQKLSRPTYRFNGHLKFAVGAGEIAAATAKRRMGSVIRFYRWLMEEGTLQPANPPWKESDRYIDIKDRQGFHKLKKVATTDLSIKVPQQDDPYEGTIEDGGKLRPLPMEEQEWLLNALINLGNTEMTLIHLFGLLTGARIQTILTFRVRHTLVEIEDGMKGEIRFPVGPGTGIDTKNDKQMVLHIPVWFYRMLQTYAHSERARKRRERATLGDSEDQYLFLSIRGAPLYQSKADSRHVDESNRLRHHKAGQGVRQFITERVIPLIRKMSGEKNFHYQFHDTRATAGMNWTDHQLKLVEIGNTTLKEAREFVKTRMGHESSATTDKYLRYRRNMKLVRHIEELHETHLRELGQRAMEGMY